MLFTRQTRSTATQLLAIACVLFAAVAHAAVPDGINYQAYLTNADGSPVDSTVTITFAAYNVDIGGVPLWNQTAPVNVAQGLFTVQLGNPANPFPIGLFDGPVYIGMFVAGEEMLPRRALTSNAYSFKANDADTVDGADAADLDQSSEVSALESAVSNVNSDVASVQGAVAANEGRISTLEATAGDITGVSAGAGLTGGGAAGSVVVGVASGGIANSMLATGSVSANKIAANAVTGAKIADGSVGPADLSPSGDYTVDGFTATGQIIFDSVFDLQINDNFHGLRWRQSDGSAENASITVREPEVIFSHTAQGRTIIRSNETGVSLAGASPTSAYAVAMPSAQVTGRLGVGYERVTTTIDISSTTPNCHSHGNLPCFYGSATVSCPVGKNVIGGGTNGVTGRYGGISISYPSSSTSWVCGLSYDIESSRTCYAICARID